VEDQIERDQREHRTQHDREQSKLGEVQVTELELEVWVDRFKLRFTLDRPGLAWPGFVRPADQTRSVVRSLPSAFRLAELEENLGSPSHHIAHRSITRTDGGILNSNNKITEGNGTKWTTGKNRS